MVEKEIKEQFCPPCLAIPVALAGTAVGTGLGGIGRSKKILIIISVVIVILSVLFGMYFLYFR